MGDLHQVVVHDIGKMIGGQLVGTLIQHLIVYDITLHTHFTTDQVMDEDLLTGLHLETDHILLTVSNHPVDLLLRKGQRVTHLLTGMAVVLEVLHLSALCLQLLRGVEGDICLPGIQQLLHILLVDVTALTLTIGTFVATEGDTLVKLNTQPLERLDDIFLCTRHETVGVRILDTEHQVTAMLTSKQIIIQCCTYSSNMQSTCRTWGKTHPYSSICHILIYKIGAKLHIFFDI